MFVRDVQVSKALMYFLYEDVAPAAVLRKRKPAIGEDGPTMYLVRFRDGSEDSWLPAEFLSEEVRFHIALLDMIIACSTAVDIVACMTKDVWFGCHLLFMCV